jgi:hypothetical protein
VDSGLMGETRVNHVLLPTTKTVFWWEALFLAAARTRQGSAFHR